MCKGIGVIDTAQRMKFSIKETVDLVTFTEKIFN